VKQCPRYSALLGALPLPDGPVSGRPFWDSSAGEWKAHACEMACVCWKTLVCEAVFQPQLRVFFEFILDPAITQLPVWVGHTALAFVNVTGGHPSKCMRCNRAKVRSGDSGDQAAFMFGGHLGADPLRGTLPVAEACPNLTLGLAELGRTHRFPQLVFRSCQLV